MKKLFITRVILIICVTFLISDTYAQLVKKSLTTISGENYIYKRYSISEEKIKIVTDNGKLILDLKDVDFVTINDAKLIFRSFPDIFKKKWLLCTPVVLGHISLYTRYRASTTSLPGGSAAETSIWMSVSTDYDAEMHIFRIEPNLENLGIENEGFYKKLAEKEYYKLDDLKELFEWYNENYSEE